MPAYLITGQGGTGKSTIASELMRQGFMAFDGDTVPGLTRSEDLQTGRPVPVDYSGFVDYSRIGWNWQRPVLEDLLKMHAGRTLFLCGSASNQALFYGAFDMVFALILPPKEHLRRLQTRGSSYGKDPAMQQAILANQEAFNREAIMHSAIRINATQSLEAVVNEILRYAHLR